MNKVLFLFLIAFFVLVLSLESHSKVISETSAELIKPLKTEIKISRENWGLKKIEAEKSWSISQGNNEIVVAIIDTGVDIHHPALKHNIWINTKEIPGNGIDDDNNGYVDDVYGWNFVDDNNSPLDTHGHGTHVTGIVQSVAPKVRFMVLKYFDPKSLSDKNLSNTVRAIDYAVEMGAHIINYSGGGFGSNPDEEAAIKRALAKNVLFVAAAGNENTNSDHNKFYPASYDLPNIISVASLTEKSQLVDSSNYGQKTIDIAAPGKDIYSTLPYGKYGKMTGTSQATAFVTGALAMLLDTRPDIKEPNKIIRYLASTGELEENLKGKTKYKTKLNTFRALSMKDDGVTAGGFKVENTTIQQKNLFSSEIEKIDEELNHVLKNSKKGIRVPAQH